MKQYLLLTNKIALWFTLLVLFTTPVMMAQCPSGSISNTAGTYTNGQIVCISTTVSGDITLNNGATMVVINGGRFTGNINAKNGSVIQVKAGGTFAPNSANNFAATISNDGTTRLGTGGIDLASGVAITNNGLFSWENSWNQNVTVTVVNTACGTMNYKASTNIQNNATINNNGTLNFLQDVNTSAGTTINNRGKIVITGNANTSGLINNQNKLLFKSSVNINSGDSVINTGMITFAASVTSSAPIRNEGLLHVAGSYTINSGGKFLINNVNAQLRVNGAMMNNAQIVGNGSFYFGGGINNNGSVTGVSTTYKLTVNTGISSGTTSNLIVNPAMVVYDTASYPALLANPAVCGNVLPLDLSALQANRDNKNVQLVWYSYTEVNTNHFTIEYSTDGKSFTSVGQVAAAGNSTTTQRYQFTHVNAASANSYYRVTETDNSGATYYTNIVLVKGADLAKNECRVYPNPFNSAVQINVQLDRSEQIRVVIYDANGRMMKQVQQQGQAGSNMLTVASLQQLLPGLYMAEITAGSNKTLVKLVK